MTEKLPPSDKKIMAELCWEAVCTMQKEASKKGSTNESIAAVGEKFLSDNLHRLNAQIINGLAVDFLKLTTIKSLAALAEITECMRQHKR